MKSNEENLILKMNMQAKRSLEEAAREDSFCKMPANNMQHLNIFVHGVHM